MSHPVRDYVSDLDRTRVTGRQKALLFVLASYYDTRYRSTNVSLETLAKDMLVDRRWIRRIIASLVQAGILGYVPGRGEGNFGQFCFPELEIGGEKGVRRGSEGGDQWIHNKERPKPKPRSIKYPPFPPFSERGHIPPHRKSAHQTFPLLGEIAVIAGGSRTGQAGRCVVVQRPSGELRGSGNLLRGRRP